MKKNISISLLLVLLITNPTNKESPIDDKLWLKGIIIQQNKPLEFNDNIEWKVKFKCNIEDNAITFFRS